MKIIVPFLNLNKSGGVRVALQYCSELAKLNHEICIFLPEFNKNSNDNTFPIPNNVKVIFFKKNILSKCFPYLSQMISCYNLIKKNDILFAISWQSYFITIFNLHPFKKTILLIQHDDDIIISNNISFKRLLFRLVYYLPIKKVTVSLWLKNHLELKYKINTTLISNGIEPSSIPKCNSIQKNLSYFNVMCIARNVKWKGFKDFINGCEIAIDKIPNLLMIIVSNESINLKTKVPYIIQKPENDDSLFKLYQSSNCFIFPSWIEGFGLPPLEAMANFVPVITTNCGGVLDYAIDNYNCLIINVNKPVEIAKSLNIIYFNPNLANKLIQNGYTTSLNFTIENMAKSFNNLILQDFI